MRNGETEIHGKAYTAPTVPLLLVSRRWNYVTIDDFMSNDHDDECEADMQTAKSTNLSQLMPLYVARMH